MAEAGARAKAPAVFWPAILALELGDRRSSRRPMSARLGRRRPCSVTPIFFPSVPQSSAWPRTPIVSVRETGSQTLSSKRRLLRQHAPLGESSSPNSKQSPQSKCATGLTSVSPYDLGIIPSKPKCSRGFRTKPPFIKGARKITFAPSDSRDLPCKAKSGVKAWGAGRLSGGAPAAK